MRPVHCKGSVLVEEFFLTSVQKANQNKPEHFLLIDSTVSIKFSYLRHLFEYIGTQIPPPSSLLYGKMGSITLFFFSNGNIKYDTAFYA